ncbi:MAG: hypothetical protein M1827_000341 [Pycnora praestabilis]|nr:MAG: hypothetical protein M1827_000341 [Pycnora praestabilis]
MVCANGATLNQLPNEMLYYTTLKSLGVDGMYPRLGRLAFPRRTTVETPHYLAITSRGAVPHISPDMMKAHTNIKGVYIALEDFIEKAPQGVPPVYKYDVSSQLSPLRQFIALSNDSLLLLAPRRIPPIHCPASNTNTAISVLTSVGFRQLESEGYVKAVQTLRPDVVVGMGDMVTGQRAGLKRVEKMGNRTLNWTYEMIVGQSHEESQEQDFSTSALFAPILPINSEQQSHYLDQLQDSRDLIHGLALYEASIISELPPSLLALPRLSLDEPSSPHKLLHEISLGVDIFAIPFIGAATDAGIALDFAFPPSSGGYQTRASLMPLGIDMWSSVHAADLSPLQPGCECYACVKHHRAYVQHLLVAKEMLGWVLLQVHNHCVLDRFFAGVRASITNECFEQDREDFGKFYENDLPEKTGLGPRVRGYQFKSEGPGEPKKNPLAYRTLDDAKERLAEAPIPSSSIDAGELEEKGFAGKV